jgi:glycosyltransferase involved in cell wall biosynthesis
MPLVSALMKSYNHERFLSESIESVLTQDFDDLELVIVDDASTDGSRRIIRSYAERDVRIRAIFHERNMGISKTVNDGIDAAQGQFIAQIDSDDVWAEDKLKKQLAVLERDEDLIVWSDGEIIDDSGRSAGKSFTEWFRTSSRKKNGNIWHELLEGNYIFSSSVVYKKQNLGKIRYDESLPYINDYKFNLELARNYEFYYIAEPLAQYRVHERNTICGSGNESKDRLRLAGKEYISICEEMLQQYEDEIRREAKAVMYGKMGEAYYALGEKRRGLHFFLQAVRCYPFETENLSYAPRLLKQVLFNLLSSRPREDPD